MKKMHMVAIAMVGLVFVQGASALSLGSGTLAYDTGIYATPNWNVIPGGDNSGTWISWSIAQVGELWKYEYVWHTDGKDLSHIIIEVTEGAVLGDFGSWEFLYSGIEDESPEVGWFSPGPGNPGMPGSLYGLKLDLSTDTPVFGFSFETWRSPVWGDFYAKDGKYGGKDGNWVYAYNAGFGTEGTDDGLHIAVPNGASPSPIIRISDGGMTVGLLGAALLSVALLRRRLAA